VLDIAVVTAILTLVVSVNGDLLTACKANESGIRPPLDLVHMRVPPPVSASIAAVELFFAARNLHDIPSTMLTLQDARPGFYYWFRGDNSHRMTPQMGLDGIDVDIEHIGNRADSGTLFAESGDCFLLICCHGVFFFLSCGHRNGVQFVFCQGQMYRFGPAGILGPSSPRRIMRLLK